MEQRTMLSAYALYQFNEGAGATVNNNAPDTSTSGASGTIVGSGVSWVTGKEGSALSFPGTGSVDIGDPVGLNNTGVITMSAWVKFSSTSGAEDIISHGYTLAPDAEVELRIYGGYYQVGSWDGDAGYGVSVPIPFSDYGHMVHLEGVCNGTKWMLYDGAALLGSAPAGYGAINVNADWMVGSSTQASDPRYFTGTVDDVRIDARALSPQEIMAQTQPLITGPTTIVEGQPYTLNLQGPAARRGITNGA